MHQGLIISVFHPAGHTARSDSLSQWFHGYRSPIQGRQALHPG